MKKAYIKKGSFWSDKKRLSQIKTRIKAGDTLADIGLTFNTTRQNIWNVCYRHGIYIGKKSQKVKKAKKCKVGIAKK